MGILLLLGAALLLLKSSKAGSSAVTADSGSSPSQPAQQYATQSHDAQIVVRQAYQTLTGLVQHVLADVQTSIGVLTDNPLSAVTATY